MPELGDPRLALGNFSTDGPNSMGLLQTCCCLLDPEVEELLTEVSRTGPEFLRGQFF